MGVNYIARQPILDTNLETWGYELLFRSGIENYCGINNDSEAQDNATCSVIETSVTNHLNSLCGSYMKLINFTKNLLLEEIAYLLPKESVIIEILEDVAPDKEVIAACRKLKDAGYKIALDDFVYSDDYLEILKYVDLVKIDFIATKKEKRRDIINKLSRFNLKILGEKIETYKDFKEATELGCVYFQGFFFSKPQVIKQKILYESKIVKQKLLSEVNSSNFVLENIEKLFKNDPLLTLRLLKFVNSSYFSFNNEIKNIKHAIAMLGEKKIKRWLTIVAVADIAKNKPLELIKNSLTRALFCESLAKIYNHDEDIDDFFFLGFFSDIEAFFEVDKKLVLEEIPISSKVKSILLNEKKDGLLFNALATAKLLERGYWDKLDSFVKLCEIEGDLIQSTYNKSIIETREIIAEFHI